MTRTRANAQLGAGLAVLCLVVLVVIDVLVAGRSVSFAALFVLAPLVACAVLPARPTAGFALAAVALAVASGGWNHLWGTTQQYVRVVDVVVVSAAAVVVAGVRVHREGRFERVAAIAEVAQRAILPRLPARTGQVSAAARYESAARDALMGGDLFDCVLSPTGTRFLVGDVRGKGIGAVEQAARTIRAFRQAAAVLPGLPEVAQDMSEYLAQFFDDEEFVTALLVDASDPARLTLVNCGHPAPVLVDADGAACLVEQERGLPLGLGATYSSVTVPWSPGQRLLMYTDGLSEARDASGAFLSPLTLVPALTSGTPELALDNVLEEVRRHVPGGRLTDDLAVVLLEHDSVGGMTIDNKAFSRLPMHPLDEPGTTTQLGANH